MLSYSHYARGDVTVLDRFRNYDDLRFCVSRDRLIYGPSPICGLPLLSAVLHAAQGHRSRPEAQSKQFTVCMPGRPSPQRQEHALPLWGTCERTSRFGWTVARLEVDLVSS